MTVRLRSIRQFHEPQEETGAGLQNGDKTTLSLGQAVQAAHVVSISTVLLRQS